MNKKIGCVIVVSLCFLTQVAAQHEGVMPSMVNVPQRTNYNPAFVPQYKLVIGLPFSSVYAQYANSSFKANDFVTNLFDDPKLDLGKLVARLRPENYLTVVLQEEIFRLGVRIHPRFYFSYTLQAKAYGRLMVPKDLITVINNGAIKETGKTHILSPQVEAVGYLAAAWTGSYSVSRKVTVGLSVKRLAGVGHASSAGTQLTVTTNAQNTVTAKATLNAKASGIENLDDFSRGNYRDYLQNKGWAFDIGTTIQATERLSVAASLLDIGEIVWRSNAVEYNLDPPNLNYTFELPDLDEVANGDESSLESLKDAAKPVDVVDVKSEGYKAAIPARLYLMLDYAMPHNFSAGGYFYSEFFMGRFSPAFSANIHKEFGRRAGLSVGYTITNNTYNNLGVGLNVNLGPMQVYACVDNLLVAPIRGDVEKFAERVQFFNARCGLNLAFGKLRSQRPLRGSLPL